MCGRYVIVSLLEAIEKRFDVSTPESGQYQPNTNISHGNLAPVITSSQPNKLQFFQFGFTPAWAKKQYYMINARSEGDHNKQNDPKYTGAMGIISKPMFRKAIRSQRCLIPADCFIEGPKKEGLNKPYVVYLRDQMRPFAFAGIWDQWADTSTGEIVNSFAIITTVANNLLLKIGHERSPVILPRELEKKWIDPKSELDEITAMLRPFPAQQMNAYPISPAIKSPRAQGFELLKPIGERIEKEYDYTVHKDIKLEGMGMTRARIRKQEKNH